MKNKKQKTYKKMVFGLLLAIVLSFVTYSYAIANTIFSASDMKAKNIQIADIRTEIAELEVEYFSLMNGISIADAESYGLQKIKVVGYAQLDKETKVAYNY